MEQHTLMSRTLCSIFILALMCVTTDGFSASRLASDHRFRSREEPPPQIIPRQGFRVGSIRSIADVIKDGVVGEAWAVDTGDSIAYVDEYSTTFWFEMSQDRLLDKQLVQGPVITIKNSNVLDVAPSGPASTAFTCTNTPKDVTFKYICKMAGLAQIQVKIEIEGDYLPMEFMWIKECKDELREGTNVGTTAGATDVINSGIPVWNITDDAHRNQYIDRQWLAKFYMQMGMAAHEQTFEPVLLDWSPEDILTVTAEGSLSEGEVVSPRKSSLLALFFDCYKRGLANVSVTVVPHPPYQPYRTMTFSFQKQCGGEWREEFDVGTEFAGYDVIMDGKPIGAWSAENVTSDPDSYMVIGSAQTITTFFWWIQPFKPNETELGVPFMSYEKNDIVEANMTINFNKSMILVNYVCNKTGSALFNLTFPMTLYNSPVIYWKKQCGGKKQGFSITTNSSKIEGVEDAVELNGKWEQKVVEDGDRKREWDHKQLTVVSPWNEARTSFIFRMGATLEGLPNWYLFSPPNITVTNANILRLTITGNASNGGNMSSEGYPYVLGIAYTCLDDGKINITMNLRLGDGYLTGKPDIYEPIKYSWVKTCWVYKWHHKTWGIFIIAVLVSLGFFIVTLILVLIIHQILTWRREYMKTLKKDADDVQVEDSSEDEDDLAQWAMLLQQPKPEKKRRPPNLTVSDMKRLDVDDLLDMCDEFELPISGKEKKDTLIQKLRELMEKYEDEVSSGSEEIYVGEDEEGGEEDDRSFDDAEEDEDAYGENGGEEEDDGEDASGQDDEENGDEPSENTSLLNSKSKK
eukprot:GILJ01004205.1.p1 GENE.GILJ01004205.1~~GILJ01004205.1.p1  ORF type:complete len:803 (+),score=129.02 GILJ01004205.1:100-2508(+)